MSTHRSVERTAAGRKRPAARRSAVKTAAIAKARAEGEARNAARASNQPHPPRKRKREPIARKPSARAKMPLVG